MLAAATTLACAFAPTPLLSRTAVATRPAVRMAAGNEAISFPDLDGKEVRVGIIKARWHEDICDSLVAGIKTALAETGVEADNIIESEVPGSFELPLATRYLALSGTCDVIIPVGLLIKGDTYHFEVIADQVTKGLMDVGLSTGIPVIFGVLTVNTEEQAVYRSSGSNNHGVQWGKAAVEMAMLRASAVGKKKSKSFLGFGKEDESKKDEGKKPGVRLPCASDARRRWSLLMRVSRAHTFCRPPRAVEKIGF
jgi:6,7-dimethyl-8-ribityllumazine synthase